MFLSKSVLDFHAPDMLECFLRLLCRTVGSVFVKYYPKELKQQVFKKLLLGYTPKELAEEFAVPPATVYGWCYTWQKEWTEKTFSDFSILKIGDFLTHAPEQRRQLEAADLNLKIIHVSGVLQLLTPEERIRIVESFSNTYSNKMLCQALEIGPSILYYHKRAEKMSSIRQRKEEELCASIRMIFSESGCRFGAERIRIRMQKQGIRINKKRVLCLIKKMNLSCKKGSARYYSAVARIKLSDTSDVKIL